MSERPEIFTNRQPAATPVDEPEQFEEGTFSDPKVRAKWRKGGKYYHLREDVRNPQTREEMDAEWEAFQKEFGYGAGSQ